MKGLSQDLELAISDAIKGMSLNINIIDIDDDKLSRLMKSRTDSFASIKELLILWENSNNSPNHNKLRKYIEELIKTGENSINVLRNALKKLSLIHI